MLRANSTAYERLIARATSAARARDDERTLAAVQAAAEFAGLFHPGRLSDGAIENLAFQVGVRLSDHSRTTVGREQRTTAGRARRRVLHVATQVYKTGGHTRMLQRWISGDPESHHHVVLARQAGRPIPPSLHEAIRSTNGRLQELDPATPLVEQSWQVRSLAQRDIDLVVLHHHPFDVVPTVAFALPGGPPVALVNHADHVFGLGATVADVTIDLRSAATPISQTRRSARRSTVLPIPVPDLVREPTRRAARSALGIPLDQTVVLSVGREEKYRACGGFSFLATAHRILDARPAAHLYVVGASAAGAHDHAETPHDRCHLVGSVEDPTVYIRAADLYIESFPFGSNTALLEAALGGLPVVPACAPLFPLLVAANDALQDVLSNPPDEAAYITRVLALIDAGEERGRLGDRLRARVESDHVGNGWQHRLANVYASLDAQVHHPEPIPASACETTVGDAGLSLRNVYADGRTNLAMPVDLTAADAGRHAVFISRQIGAFNAARRLAIGVLAREPGRLFSWRLVAVALLGGAAPAVLAAWRRLRHFGKPM